MDRLWSSLLTVAGHEVLQGELLAEGGFTRVYIGTDAHDGERLTIRRALLQDEENLEAARTEVRLLGRIPHHPHIVRCLGAEVFSPAELGRDCSALHPSAEEAVTLLEFCGGGTLLRRLEEALATARSAAAAVEATAGPRSTRPQPPGCCPCLPEAEILDVLGGIASALAHLHGLGIFHYDVKSESLLRGCDERWKLGDFGSASERTFDLTGASRQLLLEAQEFIHGRCTPFYRAPEVADVHLRWPIGPQVDVFALGCVLFTCMAGRHPFPTDSALANIQARFQLPQEADTVYGPAFRRWVRRLLAREPCDRPWAGELAIEVECFRSHGKEPRDVAKGVAQKSELMPIVEACESCKSTEAFDESPRTAAWPPSEETGSLCTDRDPFSALHFALHDAKEFAECVIERTKVEVCENSQSMRQELEEIVAERDEVKAHRATLHEQHANLRRESQRVYELRQRLERHAQTSQQGSFWSCCVCPGEGSRGSSPGLGVKEHELDAEAEKGRSFGKVLGLRGRPWSVGGA